jgi:hypothetical protein
MRAAGCAALGLALACAPLRYDADLPAHGTWADCPGAPPPAQPLRALVVAVEMSGVTRLPSGFDVDGDGAVGLDNQGWLPRSAKETWSSDPEDSVLHAQLAAVRALLADPGLAGTAVGLVAWAGNVDPRGLPRGERVDDALVLTRVLPRHALVADELERIQKRGSRGGANLAAAIQQGARLLSDHAAGSEPPAPGGTLLVLGRGAPTLPHGNGLVADAADLDAAQAAARAAHAQGVALHAALFGADGGEGAFLEDLTACVGGRVARVGPLDDALANGLARLLVGPPPPAPAGE